MADTKNKVSVDSEPVRGDRVVFKGHPSLGLGTVDSIEKRAHVKWDYGGYAGPYAVDNLQVVEKASVSPQATEAKCIAPDRANDALGRLYKLTQGLHPTHDPKKMRQALEDICDHSKVLPGALSIRDLERRLRDVYELALAAVAVPSTSSDEEAFESHPYPVGTKLRLDYEVGTVTETRTRIVHEVKLRYANGVQTTWGETRLYEPVPSDTNNPPAGDGSSQ